MNVLRNILAELVGLLIDDWLFALLVLLLVALFALPPSGPLLFGGLAVLTLIFVAYKARG